MKSPDDVPIPTVRGLRGGLFGGTGRGAEGGPPLRCALHVCCGDQDAVFPPEAVHAWRPLSDGPFATHTLRGALWTLRGGVNETLGVVAAGARGLPARAEQLPAPVVLADVEKCAAATDRGAVVALAVRNCSCAGCAIQEVVSTLDAPAMVLLLPDDGDAPPRCAFSSAVPVAAAPSTGLLAALRRGASVSLASTHPAPRLERTWRELEDLRDPANWPDDPRQRRRVRGAMRRVCDDRATRAHLDASWELVAAEGEWRDEL